MKSKMFMTPTICLAILILNFGCAVGTMSNTTPSLSKEISFKSSIDGVILHGTLSRPRGTSKGSILLIVGSGKVDRDETTSADHTFSGQTEKLFLQISDALNEVGFTTFRYDKRGVLDSKKNVDASIWITADREHLISDAIDAAKTLSRETGISADKLILLGHSEGTIISTEVALSLGGKVQGLLLLGAQARSMKDMLHFQIVESRAKQKTGIGEVSSPESEYKKALGMIESANDKIAPDGKPMAWYRQYLAAPANADRLSLVTAKKFIFQGEQDPQTPIDETDRFIKAAVKDLTIYRYPGLGHGFSPDKNGKPTLGPINEKVISDLKLVVSKID